MLLNSLLIIFSTITASLGGYFFKKSSSTLESPLDILKNIHFYMGGFLYLTSSFISIYLLQFYSYSVLLPLGSITYIWVALISIFLLKEAFSIYKAIGLLLIIMGSILLGLF